MCNKIFPSSIIFVSLHNFYMFKLYNMTKNAIQPDITG